MYKIKIIFLLPLFCLLWFAGCVDFPLVDRGLDFGMLNNTVDTITVYIPPSEMSLSMIGLPLDRPNLSIKIPPAGSHGLFLHTTKNDDYFETLPTDTLHLFILNYGIYREINWDSIVVNNLILKRVKITEDSLKAIDYSITIE